MPGTRRVVSSGDPNRLQQAGSAPSAGRQKRRWAAIPEPAFALADSDFRLLAAVALFADPEGVAFPTREQLSEVAGLSVRQVARNLKSLKAAGWIEWTKGVSGRANEYRLLRHPLSRRDMSISPTDIAHRDISGGQEDIVVSPPKGHLGVPPTDQVTDHSQQTIESFKPVSIREWAERHDQEHSARASVARDPTTSALAENQAVPPLTAEEPIQW